MMAKKAPPAAPSRDWLPAGRTMELAGPGYDPVMEAIATSQYRDALSPQPPINRMRSLSLSLPWRRPKPSRNLSVPHHINDLAVEDEAADLHERPRPRGHSYGHGHHNNGLKGIFRKASVSLKGIVHRRPSAATEDAIWEDQPLDYAPSRPTTSHLGGNRARHPQPIRHYGSFHGLNLTAEPQPIERPTHTSYHTRPGLGAEPPFIPYNTGGAAKAAAAMQNELFRGVPPLHHPTISDDNNDDESGVGITVTVSEAKEATISKVDFVVSLPTELAIQVLTYLDAAALAKASRVCQRWSKIVSNPHVWRESCLRETTKTFAMSGPILANTGLGVPPSLPNMDWKLIYKAKLELKKRWLEGKARAVYLNGHTDSIYCLQFDEHKIITGSRDKTIRVWDMHTFECRLVIGPPEIVAEKELLVGKGGVPAHFTTQADGQKSSSSMPTPLSFAEHHKASILCLQYDDQILATGSSDGTCIIHDITKGYRPIRRLYHHTAAILDLAFDDKHIVTCSKDISICVWDRHTGALIRQLRGHAGPVNAVQMRGNTIVSCSGDFRVKLWNIDTGKNIREFVGHTKGLACSQFSEDGRYVASAGNDKTIRIWDANTGECLYRMFAHDNLVRSLHIDSVSGRLVSGSYDTDIKVWDMHTGRQLLEFPKWHASWVLSAKSDYRRIVSTGQDPKILIMDFGADVEGIEMMESEGQRVEPGCGFI